MTYSASLKRSVLYRKTSHSFAEKGGNQAAKDSRLCFRKEIGEGVDLLCKIFICPKIGFHNSENCCNLFLRTLRQINQQPLVVKVF